MVGVMLFMVVIQAAVFGIGFLVAASTGIILGLAGGGWPLYIAAILCAIAVILADIWMQLALTLCLFDIALYPEQHQGIWVSLRPIFRKAWSLLWIGVIATILLIGAFLLAIIPGIFLMTAFSLATPVLLVENKKGMGALLRSRDIVKGHWWYVFGITLAVFVVTILASLAASAASLGVDFLLHAWWASIFINSAVMLFVSPLLTVAYAVLYDRFQAGVPSVDTYPAGRQWKYAWFVLPIIVLFTLLMLGTAGVLPSLPFLHRAPQDVQATDQAGYQAELNALMASSTATSSEALSEAPAPTAGWTLSKVPIPVIGGNYTQIGTTCLSFRHPPEFVVGPQYDSEFTNASGTQISIGANQAMTLRDMEQNLSQAAGYQEKDFVTSSGLSGKEFIYEGYDTVFYFPVSALGQQILLSIVPAQHVASAPLADVNTMEAVAKSLVFPCSQ